MFGIISVWSAVLLWVMANALQWQVHILPSLSLPSLDQHCTCPQGTGHREPQNVWVEGDLKGILCSIPLLDQFPQNLSQSGLEHLNKKINIWLYFLQIFAVDFFFLIWNLNWEPDSIPCPQHFHSQISFFFFFFLRSLVNPSCQEIWSYPVFLWCAFTFCLLFKENIRLIGW